MDSSSEHELEEDLDFLDLDSTVRQVEDLTYSLVTVPSPGWYINPVFSLLFEDRSTWNSIGACSPLTLAPALYNVLSSAEPPTLDFFFTLPKPPAEKVWGVYALVLEKAGFKSMLYVGSGTNATNGVVSRLGGYDKLDSAQPKPSRVVKAVADGYHISHSGLLCWTSLPSASKVPRVRARFLAIEAFFTMTFHASFAAITDAYIRHLQLWPRSTAVWEPLCTHSSLNEKVSGDLTMTEEELEIVAAMKRERRLAYERTYRAAKRDKDPDFYRRTVTQQKKDWSTRNLDKVNNIAAKVRGKTLLSHRFFCEPCDMALQSKLALDKHLNTTAHKNIVAGKKKAAMSRGAVAYKAKRSLVKANKTHFCSTCNKAFDSEWRLNRHKATSLHARKLGRSQALE